MKTQDFSLIYQKYRLYIFPAVIALSSLILIVFVIYPQAVRLITNRNIEEGIINKAKFLETKVQALESYDTENLTQKVNLSVNAYPADKDFLFTLTLLQNIISQAGFNMVSTSLGSDTLSDNTKSKNYNFKFELSGPITLLPALMNKIDNSPRLMKVDDLDASMNKNASQATVSLNVNVFYASAPSDFGNIDSPLPKISEKDEEVIIKLARAGVATTPPEAVTLGPRGKPNPFE